MKTTADFRRKRAANPHLLSFKMLGVQTFLSEF